MRYAKNREKLLNQEKQSVQHKIQTNYETESPKNLNEALLKEEMSGEELPLPERKRSNNSYRGYKNNNLDKNISSYRSSDTGNINQNSTSFQDEKRRKKMKKKINKRKKRKSMIHYRKIWITME